METTPAKPKAPTARKRTDTQIAADLLLAEKLHLEGRTTGEIAAHIGTIRKYSLTRQQIDHDLAKSKEQWLENAAKTRAEWVIKILRGYDKQEQECWQAYQRSREKKEKHFEERLHGARSKRKRLNKTAITIEGQVGDPVWMKMILDIQQARRELIGLDEAPKFAGRGVSYAELPPQAMPTAGPKLIDLEKLPDDLLEAYGQILKTALQLPETTQPNGAHHEQKNEATSNGAGQSAGNREANSNPNTTTGTGDQSRNAV